MPRVSQDYLEAQRAEILEGARRCFAAHGYEEATVVRLEEATGRSRGAIFHHFPTKLDLFLAVLERDAEREAARWETGSVADVLTGLAAEDPDWATVVIEQSRRRRTDPTFRARWSRRTNLVRSALRTLVARERTAARVAPDHPRRGRRPLHQRRRRRPPPPAGHPRRGPPRPRRDRPRHHRPPRRVPPRV